MFIKYVISHYYLIFNIFHFEATFELWFGSVLQILYILSNTLQIQLIVSYSTITKIKQLTS